MKKFLLACLVLTMTISANAQLVPLKVYNGSAITLVVHSVAVLGTTPACGSGVGATSASVGIAIPPGGTITIAPIAPGNPNVDWGAAKISSISGTTGIGAVHPHFHACFGTGGAWGSPLLTDYWYAIGATPFQVLKIY